MADDLEKLKDLAKFMSMLRYVHTENKIDSSSKTVDNHLITANLKIGDALIHLEKAFDILMEN